MDGQWIDKASSCSRLMGGIPLNLASMLRCPRLVVLRGDRWAGISGALFQSLSVVRCSNTQLSGLFHNSCVEFLRRQCPSIEVATQRPTKRATAPSALASHRTVSSWSCGTVSEKPAEFTDKLDVHARHTTRGKEARGSLFGDCRRLENVKRKLISVRNGP